MFLTHIEDNPHNDLLIDFTKLLGNLSPTLLNSIPKFFFVYVDPTTFIYLSSKMTHRFSIGFRSGDLDGQLRVLIFLALSHSRVCFGVWIWTSSCKSKVAFWWKSSLNEIRLFTDFSEICFSFICITLTCSLLKKLTKSRNLCVQRAFC